jgi:hypothetical protein
MKLLIGLSKRLGGLVLLLAIAALITGVSLFVVGGYLTTWPILRMSPITRRKQAVAGLMVSVLALAQAFQPDPTEALPEPDGPAE